MQLAEHHEVLPPGEQRVDGGVLGGQTDAPPHLAALGGDVEPGDVSPYPDVASVSVVRMRTAVVLPAPFGPSTAVTVPACTSMSMPARATLSP